MTDEDAEAVMVGLWFAVTLGLVVIAGIITEMLGG